MEKYNSEPGVRKKFAINAPYIDKFQIGSMMNQTQVETTIVEYHHFVHHCEFQMRLRIINRHAAIFNQRN